MIHTLNHWRRRRPFAAGLLTLLAGLEILLTPIIGVGLIINTGFAGVTGFTLGALLTGLGLLFWLRPAHRAITAILTAIAAWAALLTTNLAGFGIGLILALTGTAAAIAWRPPAPGDANVHSRPA